MKINEIENKQHIDELNAQQVGQAVGKGAKAIGKGVANFAKGVKQGVTGKSDPVAASSIDSVKSAITKLNPKQVQALRAQAAKLAGVA
jgi:hypothetical protein